MNVYRMESSPSSRYSRELKAHENIKRSETDTTGTCSYTCFPQDYKHVFFVLIQQEPPMERSVHGTRRRVSGSHKSERRQSKQAPSTAFPVRLSLQRTKTCIMRYSNSISAQREQANGEGGGRNSKTCWIRRSRVKASSKTESFSPPEHWL